LNDNEIKKRRAKERYEGFLKESDEKDETIKELLKEIDVL